MWTRRTRHLLFLFFGVLGGIPLAALATPAFQLHPDGSAWATWGPQGTAIWAQYRKHEERQTPAYPDLSFRAGATEDQVVFEGIRHGCDAYPICSYVDPGMFFFNAGARLSTPPQATLTLVNMVDARGPNQFDIRFGFIELGPDGGVDTLADELQRRAPGAMDFYYGTWAVDALFVQLFLDNNLPTWCFVLNDAVLMPATSAEVQGSRAHYGADVELDAPQFSRDGGNNFSGTWYDTGAPSGSPLPLRWSLSGSGTVTSPVRLEVHLGNATLRWVVDDGVSRHGLTLPANPDGIGYRDGTLDLAQLIPALYFSKAIDLPPAFEPAATITAGMEGTLPTLTLSEPQGGALEATVTVLDARGGIATGFTGTVELTSSDASAVLPGPYTFTLADQGRHRFPVTLGTGGAQSLTVRDRDLPQLQSTARLTILTGRYQVGCGCGGAGFGGFESALLALAGVAALRARGLHSATRPDSIPKGTP